MESLEFENGKYTIINTLHKGGNKFMAYRYGDEWRNLIGDNLVLSMYYMIDELINENKNLKNKLNDLKKANKEIENTSLTNV